MVNFAASALTLLIYIRLLVYVNPVLAMPKGAVGPAKPFLSMELPFKQKLR